MTMPVKDAPLLEERTAAVMESVFNDPIVKKALDQAIPQEIFTIEEQIEICEVPAPPMKEQTRAAMIAEKINSYGLEASIDPVGNVIACRKGTDPDGPVCVISAHMDNSFREGTDTTVRRQNGRLFAPGISDASRALACMLQVIRMVVNNDIKTKGTLLFIATVGQEAEGDLRGVKRIFYSSGIHVDGVLVLDGADPGRLLYGSVGSKRYKVEYSGPGGHSYLNFGQYPSATQALCRAGALLANLQVPAEPRTTFTLATLNGGSSVNAIAEHAECEIDLRSEDAQMLNGLVQEVLPLFAFGAQLENQRWNVTDPALQVRCKVTPIGHRPAAVSKPDSPVLQAARAAQMALGIKLTDFTSASTDQNVPMSLGIPSTTLGGGGREGFNHSLSEWFEPVRSYEGPQLCLLTALALVGLESGSEPLLPIYTAAPREQWQDRL